MKTKLAIAYTTTVALNLALFIAMAFLDGPIVSLVFAIPFISYCAFIYIISPHQLCLKKNHAINGFLVSALAWFISYWPAYIAAIIYYGTD